MYTKAYIDELRLKSWLKNVCIFMPLVFSTNLTDLKKMIPTIFSFVAFCLISSVVYIFNDIHDVEIDKQHPTKCKRSIASGKISTKNAATLAVVLTLIAFGISSYTNWQTSLIIVIYVVENVVYSLWLKHLPIFDCFCIAAGFIFRVYAGSFASGEPVSDWLFLTILTMSLFMAFGKRRGEVLKVDTENQRAVLKHYNLEFLNSMMFCTAGLSIVFYSLWAMVRGMYMIYTVPVIIFIVSKYLLLVNDEKSHGDPTTVIFNSRILLVACAVYTVFTVVLLYSGKFLE